MSHRTPGAAKIVAPLGVMLLLAALGGGTGPLSVRAAWAVTTAIWEEDSLADFTSGKPKHISLRAKGALTLAPVSRPVAGISALYVWDIASDAKGNLYVGTGDKGVVFKVTPAGETSQFYRSPELHVLSLAVDAGNNVYVGTSPRGIIFRVTPEGKATIFYNAEQAYIWAMAFDAKGGLIVATGKRGSILRIDPNGKARALYKSPQAHILSMVIGPKGDIFAGSAPDGIVYRIKPNGAASVLYDAREPEVHSLALDGKGRLYLGTASGGRPAYGGPPSRPKTSTVRSVAPRSTSPSLSRSRSSASRGNAVYRVHLDTLMTKCVLSLKSGSVLSLATGPQKRLYIGTGDSGRLHRLGADDQPELVLDLPQKQILSLAHPGRSLWLGTGNGGSVQRLSSVHAARGTYVSSVHDTSLVSRWGRIAWKSSQPKGTRLSLATRTGNTAKPDNTWSPWSKELADPRGSQIQSPSGRFIQYRATLTTPDPKLTPILRSVSVAYLTQNLPPEITAVNADGAKPAGKSPRRTRPRVGVPSRPTTLSRSSTPKTAAHSTVLKLSWVAKDPNGDQLVYALHYKDAEETVWKKLKAELKTTNHAWDTESVPDGKYQIRVTVSDSPDNPPGTCHAHKKISEKFVVDNTRPTILNLKQAPDPKKRFVVSGLARDNLSNIQKIEYAVDAGKWVPIFPRDRIFDATEETFSIRTGPLSAGEHTLVIRATDARRNVGTGKVVLQVK